MQKRILIIVLLASICAGCTTPTRLRERDIRTIQGISLAIDTTLAHDISGSTDTIDLPASMTITDKLLALASRTLTAKGFHIVDQHRSVGMADPDEAYYVLAKEQDYKRDPTQLQRRRGPFYSDRLSSRKLVDLYQDIARVRFASNPAVAHMGFAGDTTLLIQVRGRTIGSGKSFAAVLGNIGLTALDILAVVSNGTGGPFDLMDIDDSYHVYIRMYRTRNGDNLWRRDFKSDSVKDMLQQIGENLRDRIPAKPVVAGQ